MEKEVVFEIENVTAQAESPDNGCIIIS